MNDPRRGSGFIHRQTRGGPIEPSRAEAVAVEAVGFLAANPELAERFLALCGLDAHDLRAAAAQPSFFPSLLDFILADERTLLSFAEHANLAPQTVADARRALGGPEAEWLSS